MKVKMDVNVTGGTWKTAAVNERTVKKGKNVTQSLESWNYVRHLQRRAESWVYYWMHCTERWVWLHLMKESANGAETFRDIESVSGVESLHGAESLNRVESVHRVESLNPEKS